MLDSEAQMFLFSSVTEEKGFLFQLIWFWIRQRVKDCRYCDDIASSFYPLSQCNTESMHVTTKA